MQRGINNLSGDMTAGDALLEQYVNDSARF
jgi:hypothetical protein